VVPKDLELILSFKSRSPQSRKAAMRSLMKRGYLGCYPLGYSLGEDVVIRLLPGVSIADARVGGASDERAEGETFSPNLRSWVAARYATRQWLRSRPPLKPSEKKALVRLAAAFGDDGVLARALKAARVARQMQTVKVPREQVGQFQKARRGVLWSAIAPRDATLRAITNARSLGSVNLRTWSKTAFESDPGEPIGAGIFVSMNVFYKTGIDVSAAARVVVAADATFDFTYNGFTYGPATEWKETSLVRAASVLSRKKPDPKSTEGLLLIAARMFARSPQTYAGAAHLAAARAIARDDPKLAYVQASNAAIFRARAGKGVYPEAIAFARSLAHAHGWTDLARLLDN
jgi:hypothetical protein